MRVFFFFSPLPNSFSVFFFVVVVRKKRALSSSSFVSVCIGITLYLRAGAGVFFYGTNEFFSRVRVSEKKREKAEGCKKASARDFYVLFLLGVPSS